MKAFIVSDFASPPQISDVDSPIPGPGEVLLRVEACGLNFADTLLVQGKYQETPDLPFIPGIEVCGTVEALGPGVDGPAVGTRVVSVGNQGGLAEQACFPAAACSPVPDGMAPETAAGFQVAYGTSHLALTRRARLQPGEKLVVFGAAGGVGLTAVEIGKAMGAEVIAVARGADKLEVARKAGADHLIDASEDITARLRELGRADVVYDPVGGDLFDAALRAMRPEGRIIVIGFASGGVPKIPANHLLVKNVDVLGFYWGGYTKFNGAALAESMQDLMAMYVDGRLSPHISHVLPLERAEEGLDLLRNRKSTGKVVITP